MPAVEVNQIVKSYAERIAVDHLSFSVAQNEIFGLIGPNGAGKTSTIRMMMDIIKPDSGRIIIFGEKLSESIKNKLGYLPEERGLYRKMRVIDSIIYLASLKGMEKHSAETKADELLNKTGMLPNKKKKIEELSKGMSQMIQFIVTIIHDPELVILDEPFTGLDPVNTELLKQMIQDLRNQGKAVILSTHQMNQVEELCDRILMINNGRAVLYGNLQEIKSEYRSNSIAIEFEGDLGEVPGVAEKRTHEGYMELVLDGKKSPKQILERLVSTSIAINRFEVATPSLNEIFLKVVEGNHE
ncbi:MAG: ATP-binding cassette domain-containing protein [Coprothermobacterota bacterium]|nr:ATP-binding cassette domain-containing protein [Coprothermobacterota bacterium]